MNELKIDYLPIDSLTPYSKNARKHTKADIKAIQSSIEDFGMCDPIGIWSDKNVIVEGHGRLLALKELGYSEAPCIRLDHLSDEQRKAYALAHNKTAELSAWDGELLAAELGSIENIDMSLFGFEFSETSDASQEPIDISDKIDDVFQIVIDCESEIQQEECFYNLTKEGYKCRVLTL